MQPPKRSFRSSTQTCQPPFASSAAQASPLTPLPTMTASKSAMRELAELVVGDEATLADAELLDAGEQVCPPFFRHVEAELLGLDADRVEAALLAQDDATFGCDERRRIRLDRRRIVELRRDCTGLASKQRLPRYGLPRLERITGQLLHARRDVTDALELQVRLDAVERAQRQRDFAEIRVAGAFPHAVDRSLPPARPGTHGGNRRR